MSINNFRGRVSALAIDGPVLSASLALNILSLIMPMVILLIFDRVIPFQSTETLKMLTFALLVSAGMEFVLRWCRSALLNSAAERAAVSNHSLFLKKLFAANTVDFAKEPATIHLERYSAISRLRDHYSGQNQTLAIDLPFTAVFIAMVGLIGGWLIMVPLAGVLAVLLFAFILKTAQRTVIDARKTLDARRYTFLSEVLSHMPTVKANTMERQMTRRFELLQEQTVDTSHRLIRFSGFAQSYGAIFAQLSVASMGLFGAFLVTQEFIGIAELAACMLLNGRIIQPLMKLITLWTQAENVAVSKSKLDEMNRLKSHDPNAATNHAVRGLIECSDLKILHQNGAGAVFEGASFQVPCGVIALIEAQDTGATNAIFDAVTGQLTPEHGTISIDGHPAATCIAERGADGIVTLENPPAIFSGTVLENLSGFGDANHVDRALHFSTLLGLEKRIHRLPMGYYTKLNTGGVFEKDPVNRQLIALVRALALQPRILLMNEPTAVLDTPEREELSACLATLSPKPTILLASPDPRMKRLAGMTVHLETPMSPDVENWLNDAELDQFQANAILKGAA